MWTENEDNILKDKYPNTDNSILSTILNRKVGTIIRRANKLGLRKDSKYITELRKTNNPKIFWSKTDVNFLIQNYRNMKIKELADILNTKTKRSIIRKLSELNLKKTKEEADIIRIKNCKSINRDLNYDYVKNIALSFNSKMEFYINDNSAYSAAVRNGWIKDVTKHMNNIISYPQLLLKTILEFILNEKCSYNDRNAIKPFEIDCYFDKWKIGWEYDGIFYHKDKICNKDKICVSKSIKLFKIVENNRLSPKNYVSNIKNQLIKQINDINKITGYNITEEDIINYSPIIEASNILTKIESNSITGMKMTEIKKLYPEIFKKIKKYNLKVDTVINDIRIFNKFNNADEYISHIKNNYKTYSDVCKKLHPHRMCRKFDISLDVIKQLFKN